MEDLKRTKDRRAWLTTLPAIVVALLPQLA